MIFRRRPRLPCGCKPGRPRYDCVTCQLPRVLGEAIARARRDVVRQMQPPPAWWLRDITGGQ
jgi:hypothetical protein